MHFIDENSLMNRYLVECKSVQTLSVDMDMDMDMEQVSLPSPASAPPDQNRETNVGDSRNPNDQLHL